MFEAVSSLLSFENKQTQTYREQFAFQKFQLCLFNGLIYNAIAIALRILNRFIQWNFIERVKRRASSELSEEDLTASLIEKPREKATRIVTFIISWTASAISWYGFGVFAAIPAWLWGYQMLNFWVAVILSFLILNVRYLWGLFYHKMSKYLSYILIVGVLITLYPLGASIALEGSCQVWYEDTYGIYDNTYATRLIREWQLPTMCPPGPPCHVYATLAEDASTEVFITAHTSKVHTNVSVCWQPASPSGKKGDPSSNVTCAIAKRFDVLKIEQNGQRFIHSAYLGNLTADTLYEISIVYTANETEHLSEKHDFVPMEYHAQLGGYLAVIEYYRTLPDANSNKPLTIVMGGDAGYNNVSATIAKQAAAYKPDVIVISGDVAYDNGLQTCYYVWDQFLNMFQPVNNQKGSLVPLVLGVGNHDVGKDSMSSAVVIPDENAPLWYLMFPQHSKRGVNGTLLPEVPDIPERKTYFYNKLGRLLQVSLDSGYQESYYGDQLTWWKQLNDNHTNYLKVANYHNPIYWSSSAPIDSSSYSTGDILNLMQIKDGLTYWIPEFDRSSYLSVWENHVHVFKRTFPLRGGLYDENGTVFLGDGCWGVYPNDTPIQNSTGIMAAYNQTTNHFWLVQIFETTANYTAIDKNGRIIDHTYQNLSAYLTGPVK